MSLMIVGLSHQSSPVDLLEAVALTPLRQEHVGRLLAAAEHVTEALILSTCNRTEIYAVSSSFHGALTDIVSAFTQGAGVDRERLREHAYIHYDERAVSHAFRVAAGLDSMAVGEAQILGQLRYALAGGQRTGLVGPVLNSLVQRALRVGKAAHTDTALDSVSHGLVETGLDQAVAELGPLDTQRVVVIGAGGMSSLAAATAQRLGAREVVVVNRTADRGRRLAQRLAVGWRPFAELPQALAEADTVITCTGAPGLVVPLAAAADAQITRQGRPQVYVDLALPHDVAHEIDSLTGVTRIGLDRIGSDLAAAGHSAVVREVEDLVLAAVADYVAARGAEAAVPAVTALRAYAAEVVAAETTRLHRRVPELTQPQRDQVDLAVHRIVEKLLHAPTTRVKELAGREGGTYYADAFRELFDLSAYDAVAVSSARPVPEELS